MLHVELPLDVHHAVESFDRTLLMAYYRLLGKSTVLTVHNVNAGRRDSKDTPLNRLTLRIQYRLADHIFVHTEKMKLELIAEFGEQETRVTVIPCTSAIRGLLVFSVGHHPAHNLLVKCACCHFAQVIGVTSDPRITFPYLLKTRASTLGLCAVPAGSRTGMASRA